MARINRAELTKLEIIQVASKLFLEKGYSNTSIKAICTELNMSSGNLTFHFPTKEHLLAALVELLCGFQWEMMEKEADEGRSSVMAHCLELISMTVMCENDAIAKDFYLSCYCSPLCLEKIRRNDMERAKTVYRKYTPDWDETRYAEAVVLVSGIEYATLQTAGNLVSTENCIAGALIQILRLFCVPDEIIEQKLKKLFAMDYRALASHVLTDFKAYVEKTNENALIELLKG